MKTKTETETRLVYYLRTSKNNLIRRCASIAKPTSGCKLDLARRIVIHERTKYEQVSS